ncbi:DUF6482 family protein [Pseudomonas sp. NPDC007930]|uniref:DUF6482 family protein n=1 Tax=Pseudomonas sp. NPDC007930 TaxID=3364417 RepID=UPI0036E40DDE
MTLEQLAQKVASGQVQALDLVSVEGGSYVLHARLGERNERVLNAHGETLHVASVEEARKVLASVPQVPFFLVQPAVHEEMVGLDAAPSGPAREPIKLRSSL